MDFEHWVENKKADIAIKVNNVPKIIVECKSPEKNLDSYVGQALDYALDKQVKYVILTNGKEFRLYLSFIENIVDPRDRLLMEPILITQLKEKFEEINAVLSRKSLIQQTLDQWSEKKSKEIMQTITPQRLLTLLEDAKLELKKDITPKINRQYGTNKSFRVKVDEWIENTAGLNRKNKKEWVNKLGEEFAYSLINKLYFFRISEDKGILKYHHINAHLSDAASKQKGLEQGWNKLIKACFQAVLQYDYHAIFDEELFNEIEFDDSVVGEIVSKLTKYDFNVIDRDIIGEVYQKHLPEQERKLLGEFYTPKEVISYILDCLKLSVDSTIIDPACGSGGFLIEAYDRLKKEYKKVDWKSRLRSVHEEILLHNIFGIDINPFAVHMSAMNLALRDLTNKTDYIHVVKEDSLSGVGLERWIEKKKTDRLVSFPPKYDIIVGNPPYEVIYSSKRPKDFEYYKSHYSSAEYNPNLYALFLEKYISFLKEGGHLGFIVSNSLLTNQYFKNIRKIILDNCVIEQIIDLGSGVFEKAIVNTMIIILKRESDKSKRDNNKIKIANYVQDMQHLVDKDFELLPLTQKEFYSAENYAFDLYLADEQFLKIKKEMEKDSVQLGTIANIKRGMVLTDIPTCTSTVKKNDRWRPVLVGKDVSKYYLKYSGNYVLFDKKCAGGGCWDENIYTKKEKLLIALISGGMRCRINAMYDNNKYFALQNYNNLVMTSYDYSIKYVLALINSSLLNYYYEKRFVDKNIKRVQLEKLPIKKIGIDQQFKFIKPVDEIIKLNEQKTKTKDDLVRQKTDMKIQKLSREIDLLVYDLYGIKRPEKIDKIVDEQEFTS